ncbi:XkdF-like putative serine protease domain-containing protein [Vicingaceae bacterium]|nr:XkdF-like putative serine protease domain-containing protein [Vicingaceae bacterium]
MKRFELKKKDWLDSSVFRIALVESPAIETDFIFLSKDDKPIQLSVQDEKRMIYSPVLIPDKVIPRVSDAGDPYEIYFSGETIEDIAKDYMLKKVTLGEWNSEHNENQKLEGVDVVENWIVENPLNDKATELGFKVPAKTWMQGTYISNDDVWAKIKNGTYKGISVEADMNHELTQLNKSEMSNTNVKLDAILTKLGEMIPSKKTELASMDVGEGVLIYAESFEEGAKVYADEAMTVPAEGSFEVDGKTITIEGGVLVSMTEAEDLMKDKEEKMMEEEVVEEVKEVAKEDVSVLIDTLVDAVAAQVEAAESMMKENEEMKSELASVKETLSSLEEATNLNTEKLSKVSNAAPKSITKLSNESGSSVANYFNNRLNY